MRAISSILISLVLVFGIAKADIKPEVGITYDTAQTVADGFWYVGDLPHTLALRQGGLEVGLNIDDKYFVTYVQSGNFKSIAVAPGDTGIAQYSGHGNFKGLKGLYVWKHVAVGTLVYVPYWYEDTQGYDLYGIELYGHVHNVANLHIAPVLGLEFKYKTWRLGINEYFMCPGNKCMSDVYPPIWRNITSVHLIGTF